MFSEHSCTVVAASQFVLYGKVRFTYDLEMNTENVISDFVMSVYNVVLRATVTKVSEITCQNFVL